MRGEGAKACARALVKLAENADFSLLSPLERAAFLELTRVMRETHLESHSRKTLELDGKAIARLRTLAR